ncbi:MAG TPA: SpvB/TcaC N-terminal domain-containing protein, partial [Solirubrobacterales bacterium]|nr:SpvB/TcaC N-terminal domain-containing protein [Solirubrobacterales bacterium]
MKAASDADAVGVAREKADAGVLGPAGEAPGASRKPAVSLPKAGGAVRGLGEKFTVNAVNGTGALAVPLPLSPGRDGFTPSLRLSYDSGAGNGPFGIGWSLDVPAIARRTDRGLPRYDDEAESDVFVLAGAEDLVPELDAGGRRISKPRRLHGVDYEVRPYRPRVEGPYARIERWTALASGVSHWRTISSDNVTTLYGFDPGSSIAEAPGSPRVFSYLACRRFDGKGNLIVYSYTALPGTEVPLAAAHEANREPVERGRQRYLSSVRYGNVDPWFADWSEGGSEPPLPDPQGWHFELVLDYGEHDREAPLPGQARACPPRPDAFSSCRAGFEVRTYRRCQRALMFHHFEREPEVGRNCLVRALELRYADQEATPAAAAPVHSLLSSIVSVGYRREGGGYRSRALPPLELEYSRPEVDPTVRELDGGSRQNLPEGLDGSRYRWVDLDSEGLPGALADDGVAWRYKRNLSPLTGVAPAGVAPPPVRARLGPAELIGELPVEHRLGAAQLLDLGGGGRQELVRFGGGTPGRSRRGADGGWEPFVAWSSLPAVDWSDPSLRFVDLSGDGRADVLIGEDGLWTVHESLGEEGFAAARKVPAPWDEERGARPLFADGTETVHLADLSGDGLSDVVRIRNGEVCYWPNLGYGRFGRRVTMDAAPRFADSEGFDPRRVRLVDVDGSGTTDLLYVGADGVQVCFNRSANSWSRPQQLAVFPAADEISSVQAIDLLGTGTACLVWSSPLPAAAGSPLRYVDLMGGRKPHLLTRVRNNLGAETRLHYAPSTRFYLEDREAGRPWATRLPFPVQVVERIEVFDWVGRSRFVGRYAYHHGYFDEAEREFRGFGMVEEWDTEEHRDDASFAVIENWDAASWSPPVRTKTWFHNGEFAEAATLSRHFRREYWAEPSPAQDDGAAAALLPDSALESGLDPEEEREARRALKGRVLRREVYGEDGDDEDEDEQRKRKGASRAKVPYLVEESNYAVRRVQARGPNRHAVFASDPRESVHREYERVADDPRVTHEVTLECDAFGHPRRGVAIAYPRRAPKPAPEPKLRKEFQTMLAYDQARLHVTGTEHLYTTLDSPARDAHRIPQPCETIVAELSGLAPAGGGGELGLFTFAELERGWDEVWKPARDVPYEEVHAADVDGEGAPPSAKGRRIVEHTRRRYRRDDLDGLLPQGEHQPLALPGRSYTLALTPGLLSRVLGGVVGGAELSEGGYLQLPGHPGWWIASELEYYSAGDADPAAVELSRAQEHFFARRRSVDAFGAVQRFDPDAYDLLPARFTDAAGNAESAANDYRVLAPIEVTDPNGNRRLVVYDALGQAVGSAVQGKTGEGLGDSLAGFEPDLDDAEVAAAMADPLNVGRELLAQASWRTVYDLEAYRRTRDQAEPLAPAAYVVERETHVSDLKPGEESRLVHAFAYFDGMARTVQRKALAEPGPLQPGGPEVPRWVVSGWTVRDNKDREVRRYEPFFSPGHGFGADPRAGAGKTTFYDPRGRAVAVLNPDDTWAKTVFDAWRREEWDGNDTVGISDPRADPDVGAHFRRLLEAEG